MWAKLYCLWVIGEDDFNPHAGVVKEAKGCRSMSGVTVLKAEL